MGGAKALPSTDLLPMMVLAPLRQGATSTACRASKGGGAGSPLTPRQSKEVKLVPIFPISELEKSLQFEKGEFQLGVTP